MIGELSNHLWQSTMFAAAVGLLTVAFRENRAKVRYWLWLSASLKFFIPFALPMSLGSRLEWAPAASRVSAAAVSFTVAQITQPFPDGFMLARPMPGNRDWALIVMLGLWACGLAAISVIRLREWLRIRSAVRSSTLLAMPATVQVRSSPGLLEPGVVGLFRPILLLPSGIVERLTPQQLDAILAHEMCHVRRRDNLSAALHMVVEALFWFHPLVWWIGARLVEERERACDEDVLQSGGEPRVYAEAILGVCKYYLESPLVCVSGISGSDLKKRVGAILSRRVARNLTLTRKLVLAAAGGAALAAPIAIGLLSQPASRAQSTATSARFETASVKPSVSEDRRPLIQGQRGGDLSARNSTVKALIRAAYQIQPFQLKGGPPWTDSELFDVTAKGGSSTYTGPGNPRLQTLLAEKFQLVMRRETKDMPGYALTIAGNGPAFKEVHESDPNMEDPFVQNAIANYRGPATGRQSIGILRRGLLIDQGIRMPGLANQLSAILGGMVVDNTGLSGKYDLKVEWQPDGNQIGNFNAMRVAEGHGAPPVDPRGPSLFTALQEQLGLKLESKSGPVEVFVIERIERPSAN
jgi:uncharacterized protein (TIGR03435 family)